MEHLTEQQLDALAAGGAGESDPHVSVCSLCADRYAFLVRFHTALQEEAGIPRDPRIVSFIAKLTKKNAFVLRLYSPKPDLHGAGIDENIVVLAAEATDSASGRYTPRATFASEQDHVVLRVVHDSQEECFHLHLLTPEPGQSRHAKIEIGTPDGSWISAETDGAGVAIVKDGERVDWTHAVIAIEPHS